MQVEVLAQSNLTLYLNVGKAFTMNIRDNSSATPRASLLGIDERPIIPRQLKLGPRRFGTSTNLYHWSRGIGVSSPVEDEHLSSWASGIGLRRTFPKASN